jgi:AAA domain-containing protein/bifunctional DNA primase/polymerase-like protein
MAVPVLTQDAVDRALQDAHTLVDLGVPVFSGRLDRNGDPDGLHDPRWKNWHTTVPSHAKVSRYRQGEALCAVTGVSFDVLDYDPRNGGELSLRQLDRDLGDDGPSKFWEVKTPSGGRHLWISTLGIGSRPGFMPGLDLKGGLPDGTSRGFVFLPPTVRPSKDPASLGRLIAYRATMELTDPQGDGNVADLIDYIQNLPLRQGDPEKIGRGARRQAEDALKAECLKAEAGDQRRALMMYVQELERRGYAPEDIVTLLRTLVQEMPVYDEKRPWYPASGRDPDAYLRNLLHKEGTVIPDALPGELDGIQEPATAGLVRSVAELQETKVRWLWELYLAFRELTLLDGEKGKGKTFVTDFLTAVATRGLPFPGQEQSLTGPIRVIIFTDEGHMESVTMPRLKAVKADLDLVFIPKLRKPKRGQALAGWDLALPDGAALMGRMIREANAQLAIWDPVTDFLDETINTHNDASVRRALRPLALELGRLDCAGLALRHMNKQKSAEARYRGSGSSAFQNRARVHLVSGDLPPSYSGPARFGIAMVDTNLSRRVEQTLVYDITDSDISMDDQGNMVGMVEWHGYEDIAADTLVNGDKPRHGPEPTTQLMMIEFLRELFDKQDTWPSRKVKEELKSAGFSTDHKTLDKVRDKMGIRSVRVLKRGSVGVQSWEWTTRKDKVSRTED